MGIPELTIAEVDGSLGEMIELVDSKIPQGFYGGELMWEVMALGLIARMRDTLDSLVVLLPTRRQTDSLILLRVLYEHVVTFCWLAIDPEPRTKEWWEDWWVHRKKLHNDAAQFEVPVLTDEDLEHARKLDGFAGGTADRAKEVDDHWATKVRGFRGSEHILSLRGLYTAVYRGASAAAHATAETLTPVLEDTPRYRVRREVSDNLVYPALAVPVFAHALLVSHESIGWPADSDKIRAISDGLMGAAEEPSP